MMQRVVFDTRFSLNGEFSSKFLFTDWNFIAFVFQWSAKICFFVKTLPADAELFI